MQTSTITKMALGIGAVLLAPLALPASVASAAPPVSVPCAGPTGGPAGLIIAITNANSVGWDHQPRCVHLQLQRCNNSSMAGANALPLITSPITINGYSSATLAGNSTTFRIFQVNVPHGNLTLNGSRSPVEAARLVVGSSTIRPL